jgi:hypothetical protein
MDKETAGVKLNPKSMMAVLGIRPEIVADLSVLLVKNPISTLREFA